MNWGLLWLAVNVSKEVRAWLDRRKRPWWRRWLDRL